MPEPARACPSEAVQAARSSLFRSTRSLLRPLSACGERAHALLADFPPAHRPLHARRLSSPPEHTSSVIARRCQGGHGWIAAKGRTQTERATRGEREDGVKEGPGGREAGARRGRARRNAKESRRARRQVETRYERKDIEGEGWKERKEGRGRGCRGREGREGRARRGLAYRPSHVCTIESREGAVRRGRRGVSTSTLPLSPAPTRARRRRGQEEGDAPLSFFFSSTKTFSGSVTICVRESCVSSTSPARL